MNPADKKLNIVFVEEGRPIQFERPRESEDIKVPYEYLLSGNYEKALTGYRSILVKNPNDDAVAEGNLNDQGYRLMNSGKLKEALDIFKINTILYPNSSNTYDSYGEACMKNGETKLAIVNYKKSLELNPKNDGARAKLKQLGN
jgi:tetratricopeptide (TPR) repeat protein